MNQPQRLTIGRLNSASALMVVLVVVSAMTIVSLAGSKVLMIQFKNIRGFADSRTAFYAAEAGIEKGLLEYRRDRSKEINGAKINFSPGADASYKAFYKDKQDNVGTIEKDRTYEVDIFPSGADILTYRWQGRGKVQVSRIARDGSLRPESDLKISPGGSKQFDGNYTGFRFHIFEDKISDFSLKCTHSKCLAKKDYTIDSQASFQNVSRHLEAKINRQTGILQSLFDYTLFAQRNIMPTFVGGTR